MDAMMRVRYSLLSQSRLGLSALMCLALLLLTGAPASATATLPTVGVDLTAWVPVVITTFGGVVAIIVGGYFAFLLIKKGLSWSRKAFG